ncbi:MAG: serine protease, partial [Ilumatobacteraceae bacterium]
MTDPRPASTQRPPGRSRRGRWATVVTTGAAVTVVAVGAGACGFDAPSAVVGVVVDSCDPGQDRGSGMVVAPGLVLTSAHVLAGAQGIQVVRDDRTAPATIVAFDPEMDLAYLSTDLPGRPIPL